jgi:hypothetical protein
MHIFSFLTLLLGLAYAQAPDDISVCNYYGAKLNSDDTVGQKQFITTFVQNLFGGSTSSVFSSTGVHGLLTPATYNDTTVSLHKYFDGSLFSTNTGKADAINWLDDGGLVAIEAGMSSYTNSSNQ